MRRLAVVASVVAVGVLAPAALANWSSTVVGGAMTVSTATLDDPGGLTAKNRSASCTRNDPTSLRVALTWTASTSPVATGYVILRDGTQVATVSGVSSTSWTDKAGDLAFSTTYTYTVESSVGGWTSPGATVSNTTLNNKCR